MYRIPRKSLAGAMAAAAACAPAMAETFDVSLDGLNFVYDGQFNTDIALQVNTGDTVRWTWISGFHNVVSGLPGDPDPGSFFDSGDPTSTAGTIFEHTFTEIGVYDYHCEIHASLGMMSRVTVVPGPASVALLVPVGLVGMRRRR